MIIRKENKFEEWNGTAFDINDHFVCTLQITQFSSIIKKIAQCWAENLLIVIFTQDTEIKYVDGMQNVHVKPDDGIYTRHRISKC